MYLYFNFDRLECCSKEILVPLPTWPTTASLSTESTASVSKKSTASVPTKPTASLTTEYVSLISSTQLWTLNGSTLENKANIWQSNEKWRFIDIGSDVGLRVKVEEAIVYIENISKKKALSVNGDEVELVSLMKSNPNQMWNKGFVDVNGYFTLTSRLLSSAINIKALTAISVNSLGIRGR